MATFPLLPGSADAPAVSQATLPVSIPLNLMRPAAPTLRAALTYIRVQAEAAEARAGALTREAGLFHELAATHQGHARHLEDLLFLIGEAA